MDEDELAVRLVASGYNRGPILTSLFTERLKSMSKLSLNLDDNEFVLREGSEDSIAKLLMPIHGVGRVVISNFIKLRKK